MKTASAAVFTLVLLTFSALSVRTQSTFFVLKEQPAASSDKSSIGSVREAAIDIAASAAAKALLLDIPLFDGKVHRARRIYTESRALDDFTWFGKMTSRPGGDVILTFRGGFVSGLVYGPKAVYEVVPRGDRHVLVEVDQNRLPECGGGTVVHPDFLKAEAAPSAGTDSGDRVDVLVVYTTATKNFLGGDPQARTLAQQAVDATNAAYFNSRVRQRVRLVHAAEFVYVESGNSSTDLSSLRTNAAVQALRNEHKADLVALLGEFTDVCGRGYLVGTAGGAEFGYSLTARSCAVGNLSFAHELGHNMGSQHNPENGSGAVFPFSYGHYVSGVFRTVMSYVDPCTPGCPRRPYFSNPGVLFNGLPTGLDGVRDNARSLNSTADNMANYRYSGAGITLTSFSENGWLPRMIGRTINWTSDNVTGNVHIQWSRDEGMTWTTVIPDAPNTGSAVFSVSGLPSRQGRMRVVSVDNPAVSDSSVQNIALR